MSLKYAALSLFALSAIALLIFKNYETWTRPIDITPERNTVKKQETKIENPPRSQPQRAEGSAPSQAIAAKNIFSPDRKDFPVQSAEARKVVRPQVLLYGITMGEGYEFASVVNPGRSLLRGERETLSLKVGDKVGEYRLAKISSDRISLEAEGDAFEVLLYDPRAPKKRTDVKTDSKPAAVTSTLPTPEAPQKTPPAVPERPAQVPPAVITRPVPSPTAPTQVPRPVLPSRRRMILSPGAGTPTPPGASGMPAGPAPNQEAEEN